MFNHLPSDIIIYIYQFDDTYNKKYKKCIDELKVNIDEYYKKYNFTRTTIINSIHGDEAYNPNLYGCIKWNDKYGKEYYPSFYILDKLKVQ